MAPRAGGRQRSGVGAFAPTREASAALQRCQRLSSLLPRTAPSPRRPSSPTRMCIMRQDSGLSAHPWATDGRCRRKADIADRGLGRLNWAEVRLHESPREGPECEPKLPFHCEHEIGFTALCRLEAVMHAGDDYACAASEPTPFRFAFRFPRSAVASDDTAQACPLGIRRPMQRRRRARLDRGPQASRRHRHRPRHDGFRAPRAAAARTPAWARSVPSRGDRRPGGRQILLRAQRRRR